MREIVIMVCGGCGRYNYTTTRNKKKKTAKLELQKFCRSCRKYTKHKEK